jgi:hypothetical protein
MQYLKQRLIEAGHAIAYTGETVRDVAQAALRVGARKVRELSPAAADAVGLTEAEDAMNAALAYMADMPATTAHDGRPYSEVVNEFITKWHGHPGVDMDGLYGPQSPDLITLYVREFQPGWMFRVCHAAKLWRSQTMPAGFMSIPGRMPTAVQRGDIAITPASALEPFGNCGIVTGTEPKGVRILTQTPTGIQFHTYPFDAVSGYYRWVGVPA